MFTKQSHRQTFRISGAFCFIFELSGGKKGVGNLHFNMGQDQSSAGPDHSQFDKMRWTMVWQLQAEGRVRV
jgi:hypothetical protein